MQDVIDHHVVDLLKARVRNARHHGERLVRVRQLLEELHQVFEAGDAVPLAAHDDRRRGDLLGIDDRQLGSHVDVSPRRHRIVEREDRVGERFDRALFGATRMIPLEYRINESTIDRAAIHFPELGELLRPLLQCRAAFAGPYESVERKARDPVGIALREERRAQRARRDPVDQKLLHASGLHDVLARRREIVGAVRDIEVHVALLVGAAVAFHVDRPGVEAALREPVHRRRIGAAGDGEVERRLRRHRRAVHEQDRRLARIGAAHVFLPEKQAHLALVRPVFVSGHCLRLSHGCLVRFEERVSLETSAASVN
jgi:hypothetical protein